MQAPSPIAVNLFGCSYSNPTAQNAAGYFSSGLANGQFGAINWGDGAGVVQMHDAYLFQLPTKQGATLNSAILSITNGPTTGTNATGVAYVEAVDNALAPVGSSDALARTMLAQTVAFTMLGTANAITLVNLTAALQVLTARNGWAPYNQLAIYLKSDNTNAGGCTPGMAPKLEIIAGVDSQFLSHAQKMVVKLEALLEANPNAASISIDGTSTTYVDMLERLAKYRRIVSLETGERQVFTGIGLGAFTP